MRVIRFVDGKIEFLNKFTWDDLHNEENLDEDDLRFTLFTGNLKEPKGCALFFDVDDLPESKENSLVKLIEEEFKGKRFYILYTGGGYHIYVPLKEEFTKEDIPYYKGSYEDLIKNFEKEIEHKFDKVFKLPIYGRVVGSHNKKENQDVQLLAYSEDEICENIEKILEKKEIQKYDIEKKIATLDDSDLTEHLYYKNCRIIKKIAEQKKEIPYDLWSFIMTIFTIKKSRKAAHAFSLILPKYNEKAVDAFFDTDKTYFPTCDGLRKKWLDHSEDDQCLKCPHNCRGNNFPSITGEIPTPSYTNGFHVPTKEGINYSKYKFGDIAGFFININKERLIRYDTSLYFYTGKHYELVVKDLFKMEYWEGEFLIKLSYIPTNPIRDHKDTAEIKKEFGLNAVKYLKNTQDIDDPDILSFNNGIYDLKEGVLKPHSSKYKITTTINLDYDPSKKCPSFFRFMDRCLIDKDKYDLVQAFMGMALSNIPLNKYQNFLWLFGISGSGKTAFVTMLTNLFGYMTKGYPAVKLTPQYVLKRFDQFVEDPRGKKLLFVDDLKLRDDKERLHAFENWVTQYTAAATVNCKIPYIPVFNAPSTLTLFVTSNNIPENIDSSEGLLRRVRMVEFCNPVRTVEARKDIMACMEDMDEIHGMVMWALEGLEKCRERYLVTGEYLPPTTEEEKAVKEEQGFEDKDTAMESLMDKLEISLEYKGIYLNEIASKYKTQEGYRYMTQQGFREQIIKRISEKLRVVPSACSKRMTKGKVINFVKWRDR